jgi:peptide/nickel transport system substrate-binding protein
MGDTEPAAGGTLRVALDWEVDVIDPPASFGGWNTARVAQQIFESLIEDDLQEEDVPFTTLVPGLAHRYEVSSDGLTHTFFLRDNVRFHDGTPFDAQAVRVNLERMWREDSPHFSSVAADYNQVALQSLDDVQVLDRHTVRITLREPFAEFLRLMTQEDAPGSVVFVSPDALARYGNDGIADHAPGTGPFRFAERFSTPSGSGVEVARNDDYWDGAPHLDGIRFIPFPDADDRAQALLDGEVDLAYGPEPTRLKQLGAEGFVIREGPIPYVWYFIFNTRNTPFRDPRVRRAVAFAFDRQRLSEAFGGGTSVTAGILPPASPSYEPGFPEHYPYDPARATALLAEAGHASGFTFPVLTATAGSAQLEPLKICEHLKQDLAKVGITVDVIPRHDWVSYCEEWRLGVPETVGASEMSWGMSCDAWIEQIAHSKNASPKGFNAGYYARSEVDRLFDLARTELSGTRRTELYRIAHRLIMGDLPLLPVLTVRAGAVVHSQRVRDFRFPRQNWHDFKRVWLAREG